MPNSITICLHLITEGMRKDTERCSCAKRGGQRRQRIIDDQMPEFDLTEMRFMLGTSSLTDQRLAFVSSLLEPFSSARPSR